MKMTDQRGYTLLESIFQLMIMVAFIQLFLLFFFWKEPIEQQYSDYSATEWELFSIDLQLLLSDISDIQLRDEGRTIRIRNSRGIIDISQSNTVIRQQVYGKGHVPLLTEIQSVTYAFDGMELVAYVTMRDGSHKERGFAVGLYSK
ncbi:competence type IV pilus minor pilin ComGF [Sporosarcina limicola]|uniref:Competence protein ComGF n=1 Tax=Sporosarcina limicola TaxID=34101 RepID=A0A927MIG4_9BACL|nr:competence type IV pilus minor pilin ComGF [Sporosarcina limicola]MBE1553762.1 competence protein ComGF [Sporosarcina limicola]